MPPLPLPMLILLRLLAILLAAWASLLFIRLRAPLGFMLFAPKLFAGALTPLLAAAGALAAALSLTAGAPVAALVSGLAAAAAFSVALRVTRPHAGFEQAFGAGWQRRIPPGRQAGLLARRWQPRWPAVPEPRLSADIGFWTVPDAGRDLLCDVWQPPPGIPLSGLALIFLHGSAWYILDKDFGTRPMFRRLCAQGHVVMDVAYRLYPETDLAGMLGDVKRAIAWAKQHAADYGFSRERIVVGGASAGGHLALLAAYAPDQPELTPAELRGSDLSVRGVVSLYGPADLAACYAHTNQHRTQAAQPNPPDFNTPPPAWLERRMGRAYRRLGLAKAPVAGRLDWLLGGTPQAIPERFALFSPLSHAGPGCPPTLLIQGADDLITPVSATRALHARLAQAGVPAVNVVLPHTEHGFDLALPGFSPAAQSALYDLDRFLALMAGASGADAQ